MPSPSVSVIAWFTICCVSATMTWRAHDGFSYQASSCAWSELAMTSILPSLLKSATETL
jgi:hypothetical protein